MHNGDKQAAFLTADEAHAIVGKKKISRRSFYYALNTNQIPNVRISPRRILIPRHAFGLWLEKLGARGSAA